MFQCDLLSFSVRETSYHILKYSTGLATIACRVLALILPGMVEIRSIDVKNTLTLSRTHTETKTRTGREREMRPEDEYKTGTETGKGTREKQY